MVHNVLAFHINERVHCWKYLIIYKSSNSSVFEVIKSVGEMNGFQSRLIFNLNNLLKFSFILQEVSMFYILENSIFFYTSTQLLLFFFFQAVLVLVL